MKQSMLRDLWREHGLPVLLYALLTMALTWPAVRDFSDLLISNGGDARNNLWLLWHVKEVVKGNHHLFETPLLYYPLGVNLLARGLGPVVGLLALPFWPFGPEAAYNGSLLTGFWLTGYAMYLLGRGIGLERRAAFFAGVLLLAAPMHLAGLLGHMTKTFLALPPLALLALHKALDSRRSRWWTLVVAAVLFLLLFHNLYQLVFTGLAFVFFTVAHLLLVPGATAGHPASQESRSKVEERRAVLRRAVLTVGVIALLVGPFTLPFIQVALDTTVTVDANLQSLSFQPDAVELFLPPSFTQFWGAGTVESLEQADVDAFNIESNVYLTWTALILTVVAFFRGPRRARPWILFSLLCALLALGPVLQWLGQRTFTEYEVRILLPYAWLTGLPGFDFMRAPGRFMMIGSVALAISAAFGLAWLLRRYPQHALLVTLAATAFALIEVWPRPWPQEALAPVPDFYLQIAADEEMYGVFDLPVKPEEDVWFAEHAAYFQRYQIEHHKGIASGYLARTYTSHPMFPCVIPELREPSTDVLVDGEPADCAANILYDLATYNYRYIVYHKVDLHRATVSPAWGRAQARQFVDAYLEGYEPLVDDELVTVYSVPALEELSQELSPTLGLLDNWYRLEREGNASWRWAQSPATIFLSIPRAQQFVLKVTPGVMFAPDADSERVRGFRGRIQIELNGELVDNLAIRTGRPFAVELDLPAGIHTVALSLEAGNFQAADYEGLGDDRRQLSFTIRSIELITEP